MQSKPLLTFRDAVIPTAGGSKLGPIQWVLQRGERVCVESALPGAFEALAAVLMGQARPSAGFVEELETVVTQSDAHLRETLDLNRSIQDLLQKPEFPPFVWLEGRRRSLGVLMDRLALAPNRLRMPLKMEPPEVVDRFVALRFILSRADLLIGREVFACPDEPVRKALRARWDEFPGAVVAGGDPGSLPGKTGTRVVISAEGTFSSGPF